ncbi:MAG: glucose-1-phosphate adenylyltransferase subunit GlgD [Clostridia bacterium]|nr:glucose-1-phosphate adenylyltransferase subunit GlgD [Clostridia bacterium]
MSVTGIIFSNVHDSNIPELTRLRTTASVPYGCRYRFIDFTLSNMVNSGVTSVGIITQANYQSLVDHIGTGKDWDLASRSGGIKLIPPNFTAFAQEARLSHVPTRLESLKTATVYISRRKEDLVVLSDCDVICNIDLGDMIDFHQKNGADITIATKKTNLTQELAAKNVIVRTDGDSRVNDLLVYPKDISGEHDISLNIIVIGRQKLLDIIMDASAHGYTSFNSDVILRNIRSYKIMAYSYEGYFACVSSLAEYFACSMQLLDPEVRRTLFKVKNRPVYTKVRNSPPTRYTAGSFVSNSLLADGCVISGTVENSIIFRGVTVRPGAVVRNSIVMQDTVIGSGASLNCTVLDKNVIIKDGVTLSGHESYPFYVPKNSIV